MASLIARCSDGMRLHGCTYRVTVLLITRARSGCLYYVCTCVAYRLPWMISAVSYEFRSFVLFVSYITCLPYVFSPVDSLERYPAGLHELTHPGRRHMGCSRMQGAAAPAWQRPVSLPQKFTCDGICNAASCTHAALCFLIHSGCL